MFPINDMLDSILLGSFFFGIVFTIGSLLLGFADLGGDSHASGHHDGAGHFHGLLNVSAILAFVTWFGGIGYLVRNGIGWFAPIAILIGLAGGLLGAFVVGLFFNNVLRAGSESLDPGDFERVGALGRVTSSIRSGGVGEIVFERHGSQLVTSARSRSEQPIGRGTEVVILSVERGTAVVEPFDALLEASGPIAETGPPG